LFHGGRAGSDALGGAFAECVGAPLDGEAAAGAGTEIVLAVDLGDVIDGAMASSHADGHGRSGHALAGEVASSRDVSVGHARRVARIGNTHLSGRFGDGRAGGPE